MADRLRVSSRALVARSVGGFAFAALVAGGALGGAPSIVEPARFHVVDVRDGHELDVPKFMIWKPICGPGADELSMEEFRREVEIAKEAPTEPVETVSHQIAGSLFDVVFNVVGTPPAGMMDSIAAVEQILQFQMFTSNVSTPIQITIQFADLGNMTIGATNISGTQFTYADTRARLLANADSDDYLPKWLPSGSTYDVRFTSAPTVTAVSSVTHSCGNIEMAYPIACTGAVATITINTQAFSTFDYDPSNGITPGFLCFRSVLSHEVVHALGFDSVIDYAGSGLPPFLLDLFRFQRSTSNPYFPPEFQATPRLVTSNDPDDDVDLDLAFFEYAMSDGSPRQASHWREQNPAIGLMDPALDPGETFFPDFLKRPDLRALDAIGAKLWDIDNCISGQVGVAAGAIPTNVLAVNGQTGYVRQTANTPFTISLASSPYGPVHAPYVLWAWSSIGLIGHSDVAQGFDVYGCTLMPNPFSGGPALILPFRCLTPNGVPLSVCGTASHIRGPRSTPFSVHASGLSAGINITIQGVMRDEFAFASRTSVTNAVLVETTP